MKRLFDIFFSVVVLSFASPLIIFIGLIIKATDSGPIFFKQIRIGKGGNPFFLYKLRSMYHLKSAEKGSFDAGKTERVTPIGKIIRKTKLDELPQFINVLKGDMSIVGPRPEVKKWVDTYPERWSIIHQVKPGITDPASIFFRNEEEILSKSSDPEHTYQYEILPLKLDLYEMYIKDVVWKKDIFLILKTIKAVMLK